MQATGPTQTWTAALEADAHAPFISRPAATVAPRANADASQPGQTLPQGTAGATGMPALLPGFLYLAHRPQTVVYRDTAGLVQGQPTA